MTEVSLVCGLAEPYRCLGDAFIETPAFEAHDGKLKPRVRKALVRRHAVTTPVQTRRAIAAILCSEGNIRGLFFEYGILYSRFIPDFTSGPFFDFDFFVRVHIRAMSPGT